MAIMHLLVFVIFVLGQLCSAPAMSLLQPEQQGGRDEMVLMHEQWMAEHGRVYEDADEMARRFNIFRENVQFISSFNAKRKTYKLGINRFSDLTNEEFFTKYMGFNPSPDFPTNTSLPFRYANVTNVPKSVDWRENDAVTPIKDQGHCGSCWAFSAVAAVEGTVKLKTGKLISLSEQELVDCDTKDSDHGCEGGLMDGAFKFIKSNNGLTTEDNYPYKGNKGTCTSTKLADHAATITGYEDVPANDEGALLKAVANQPVAVAIEADSMGFQFYDGGIFDDEKCGSNLNHGVAVVGYGVGDDGTDYWLVKNSWGKAWGMKGYIKMKRGVASKTGMCGIAMQASYPVA